MKIVIQRVLNAGVEVNDKNVGAIGPGVVVFIGITQSDTINQAI